MLSKIIDLKNIEQKIISLRKFGKTVVFTNGCFDLLHIGHIRYLAASKSKGDILVVGLNSDESVRSIKGKARPVICQEQRAEILASILWVDYVVMFSEPDPLKLIKVIKPDFLVKGADWSEDKIIGADFVKANNGRVVTLPLVKDISTSIIIKKILSSVC